MKHGRKNEKEIICAIMSLGMVLTLVLICADNLRRYGAYKRGTLKNACIKNIFKLNINIERMNRNILTTTNFRAEGVLVTYQLSVWFKEDFSLMRL